MEATKNIFSVLTVALVCACGTQATPKPQPEPTPEPQPYEPYGTYSLHATNDPNASTDARCEFDRVQTWEVLHFPNATNSYQVRIPDGTGTILAASWDGSVLSISHQQSLSAFGSCREDGSFDVTYTWTITREGHLTGQAIFNIDNGCGDTFSCTTNYVGSRAQ